MNEFSWVTYPRSSDIIVESPSGHQLVLPGSDTRYILLPSSLLSDINGYSLITKPSYTTYFLPDVDGHFSLPQNIAGLKAALNRYFINTEDEVATAHQEKPKKYMRLPNSSNVVYLVDILNVARLTHGDHLGDRLFIQYPVGDATIYCNSSEDAIADERALTEYLLSL